MPKHVNAPRVDEGLVLRALVVSARAELEMEVWNAGIDVDYNGGEEKEREERMDAL